MVMPRRSTRSKLEISYISKVSFHIVLKEERISSQYTSKPDNFSKRYVRKVRIKDFDSGLVEFYILKVGIKNDKENGNSTWKDRRKMCTNEWNTCLISLQHKWNTIDCSQLDLGIKEKERLYRNWGVCKHIYKQLEYLFMFMGCE